MLLCEIWLSSIQTIWLWENRSEQTNVTIHMLTTIQFHPVFYTNG